MDWILDEVKENIKNQIEICENFMEVCDSQIKDYKNRYETDNIGDAVNFEYWRTCKIRTAYEIKDLKELLQEIDEMMQEEVKQLDEADEDERINRADACI